MCLQVSVFVCFCSLGWNACARGNFGFHDLTFEETEAQEEETLKWANRNMISVAWLTPTHNPFPFYRKGSCKIKSENEAFQSNCLPIGSTGEHGLCWGGRGNRGGGWNVRGRGQGRPKESGSLWDATTGSQGHPCLANQKHSLRKVHFYCF